MTPIHETRTGKCARCGRPVTLHRTFTGLPSQSPQEAAMEAEKAAQQWKPEVFYHNTCLEAEQVEGQTDLYEFFQEEL